MSQKKAEKIVSDFVKAGELRRKDAETVVQHLVERGRESTEHFVSLVQAEVAKQLARSPIASTSSKLSSKALPARLESRRGVPRRPRRRRHQRQVRLASPRSLHARHPPRRLQRRRHPRRRLRPRRHPPRRLRPRRPRSRRPQPRRRLRSRRRCRGASGWMPTWCAAGWSLSRAEAARAIEAGLVLVNGSLADKPARLVDPGDAVVLQGPPPRFVSRGGDKLDAALESFGDRRHRSARARCRRVDRRVHRLSAATRRAPRRRGRCRPRPVASEDPRRSAGDRARAIPRPRPHRRRDRRRGRSRGRRSVVHLDHPRAAALVGVCRPGVELVLLVKPQFEAGKAEVDRGSGVIRDPAVHQRVCDEVSARAGRTRLRRARLDRLADHRRAGQPRVPCACPPRSVRICTMTDVLLVAHHDRLEAAALGQTGGDVVGGARSLGVDDPRGRRAARPARPRQRTTAGVGRVGLQPRRRRHDAADRQDAGRRRGADHRRQRRLLGYLTEVEPPALDGRAASAGSPARTPASGGSRSG